MEKDQSFHKILSRELSNVDINRTYSSMKKLGTGRTSKVYSAKHPDHDKRIVLKCILKEATKKKEFLKEFHYSYSLSTHPTIINTFETAFETSKYYVFAQELAPETDLSKVMKKGGVGEEHTKRIAELVAFALEFIHGKDLVHRDICLENIFVFDKDYKTVKIGDFGHVQKVGTVVKKIKNLRTAWAPPEVCAALPNEGYSCKMSVDAWQLGILIFACLTGAYPWYSAEFTDNNYKAWVGWIKKKTTDIPPRFSQFSPRLLSLFRRLLEPKPSARAEVKEVYKYALDPWLPKDENDEEININLSCPNVYLPNATGKADKDQKEIVDVLRQNRWTKWRPHMVSNSRQPQGLLARRR
ncbi:unnamed protein product [Meganyctiphanes norvegica]|uniref:Protein kinase domain-containing protein n=1 Tax=Meganyctiphanes norvegica TaxID=48144 RepID=A0AAV2RW64_MEGNR